MDTDKQVKTKVVQPYTCVCGIVIAHKRKSLKRHLLTKIHSQLSPCPPHHWIIESATGHLSSGYCQNCNEKKNFENSITQGYAWYGRAQREYDSEERTKENKKEVEDLANSNI